MNSFPFDRAPPPCLRSWLQDALIRKLAGFAWNRRFLYLPGACSPLFGSTRLKVAINPILFIRSICFDQSSGQPRVNPGNQGGGAQKNRTIGEFLFEVSCSQRRPDVAFAPCRSQLGLSTILPLTILYGLHCNTGWSGGNTILRTSVSDAGGEWGAQTKGGVFANNTMDSCTKASNKTNLL